MDAKTKSYLAITLGAIIAVADIIWIYQSYYDVFWLALGIVILVADLAWIAIDYSLMSRK